MESMVRMRIATRWEAGQPTVSRARAGSAGRGRAAGTVAIRLLAPAPCGDAAHKARTVAPFTDARLLEEFPP